MATISSRCVVSQMRREICRALKVARYRIGEVICTQGEPGDAFYVLLSGHVAITKDGHKVAVMSTPGTGFGEVALDRDAVRKAVVLLRKTLVLTTLPWCRECARQH